MNGKQSCPECKAVWQTGVTCQDHFHQMLFWESENPDYGVVHHFMVLCYYMQHPRLYSPQGLEHAKRLLVDFLEHGLSTEEVRRRTRDEVGSANRTWKIKGTGAARGAHKNPIRWTMTAGDATAGGAEQYCDRVRAWAKSVLQDLKASNNL